MSQITTDRLILRQWRQGDYEPFAAMNADPKVMEFFTHTRTRAQSDATADWLTDHIDTHGFGFWALERRDSGEFIGFTSLQHVDFDAGFLPAVEIGIHWVWRVHNDPGHRWLRELIVDELGLPPAGSTALGAPALGRVGTTSAKVIHPEKP